MVVHVISRPLTTNEIPSRQREQPWFRDEHLTTLTRRDDLFVEAVESQAAMQVAKAAGATLTLAWMSLEEDALGIERPVQRLYSGVAVMDVIDAYPLGWAYIAHPDLETVLAVSLDVITNIRVEL